MSTVSFSAMADGTADDYRLLDELEQVHVAGLPDRILRALSGLSQSLDGYKIDRLQHSLQSATRAEADGADIEWIVAALIHDIGDELAPLNHSQFAAAMIRPYVRAEVTWVIEMHGLFQMVYYAHHLGQDPNGRDAYREHPWFESCVNFCERWDQTSFDPDYPTRPLDHFAPMVREIFSRPAFDPAIIGEPAATT
jgi:predicted HD phosphohydrolase